MTQINSGKLEFTGNWFIDAGILGFVNLMEEVYGWDLEELQKRIEKEPEKVYYGYFPIAFVYYNNKVAEGGANELLLQEVDMILENQSDKKIFEKAWEFILNNYVKENKVNLRSKGIFYYFHNFLFFQPRWKKDKQKKAFQEILGLIELESEVLKNIDRTINKFLPSANEFSNLSYTKSFINISSLREILQKQVYLVYVLTFPFAFIPLRSEKDNTLFYSPNIELTYKINKKLKTMIKNMKKETVYNSIFRRTWDAILDSALETESLWSIENMYLINYRVGKNQEIFNVVYMGIPKLQASIIMDDVVRNILNVSIQFRSKNFKGDKYIWLLEEFIKGRPLYPIILNHVNLGINEEIRINKDASLYSLIVEANISDFKKSKKAELFSENYFGSYKSLVNQIKKDIKNTLDNASLINQISKDDDTKKRIARELLEALKVENKNLFLNILLKNINENKKLCANKNLTEWIFDKIINNNESFIMYGLILIMNLVCG
ncbi:MAG: hypothetical protein QXW65_02855 [Candidatus Pacearchaeota archaeon]